MGGDLFSDSSSKIKRKTDSGPDPNSNSARKVVSAFCVNLSQFD